MKVYLKLSSWNNATLKNISVHLTMESYMLERKNVDIKSKLLFDVFCYALINNYFVLSIHQIYQPIPKFKLYFLIQLKIVM